MNRESGCRPRSTRDDFVGTPHTIFVIYLLMLLTHGLLNAFGVNLVKMLGDVSVWWHVAGVAVIVAILFVVPDNREGLSIVTEGRNLTGWSGPFAGVYVALLGLLLAQYTITGFDASAPEELARIEHELSDLV